MSLKCPSKRCLSRKCRGTTEWVTLAL